MEWQRLLETLSCKLRSTCNVKTTLKQEDELMTYLWADQGALKLVSLWLKDRDNRRESKSCAQAKTFRIMGNKEFQAKNYGNSIELYTKSAVYAPTDSNDLAVAIANRSAALFYLGRYNDCIKDIELAKILGYPDQLHYKLYLREIQCYLKLGKSSFAEETIARARQKIETCEDITSSMKSDIEKKVSELALLIPCAQESVDNTITQNDTSSKLMPQVAHGENPTFLHASIGIDKRHSEKKGRHVVANRDIKKGDILFVEKPVSFVLLNHETINNLCSHCCCSCADIPVPCKTCVDTLYCNVKCLNDGWSSYHCWECPGSQIGLWKEIGIAHLALKVLLTCTTTTDRTQFNEIQQLVSNFDKLSINDLMVYGVTAMLLTIYLSEYTNYFDINDLQKDIVMKFFNESSSFDCDLTTDKGKQLFVGSLLLRYILQLVSNGHAIAKLSTAILEKEDASSEQEDIVATGIYPSASMMNHSCDPNIINIFADQYLIVRASKDIAADEEVFNCYGPHYRRMLREQRQKILKSQYCFSCKCEACTFPKFRYFLERFSALKCSNCDGASCGHGCNIYRCLDCGTESSVIHDQLKLQQADEMFNTAQLAIEAGREEEALKKLKHSLDIRQSVLYKYHRDITSTFSLIGEIYAALGRWLDSALYQEYNIEAASERFGASSVELANEMIKLTDVYTRYLREEPNKSAPLYKDILKKAEAYLDRTEEIVRFNYGHWNDVCEEIKKKKKECAVYIATDCDS